MSEVSYKYRIYPNKKQKQILSKFFGCARFVYNYYLDKRIEVYKKDKTTFGYKKCSKDLTILKAKPGYEWLKETDSVSLQSALKNLETAFKNFFERPETGFPKFKSKKSHSYSYTTKYTNGNIVLFDKYIKLPKIGLVKTKVSRPVSGRILSVTVSQTPSRKYYVSVCCTEVNLPELDKTGKTVGIDLGIKDFMIFSDESENLENPKFLQKGLTKLAHLQRELSRKTSGSRNWEKARVKVARQHEKIHNKRQDFLHKATTDIARNYDVICVEDLNVSGIIRDPRLSRNIADVSWAEAIRQLAYKAAWYGKKLVKVNRFFPSSQICNACGYKNLAVKDLNIRKWTCPECGTAHNRDKNSAINIHKEGLKLARKYFS